MTRSPSRARRRHVGLDQAWSDGVDGQPDAVAGELVRLAKRERGLASERLVNPNRPDFEAA
jgi:hypothetical protein